MLSPEGGVEIEARGQLPGRGAWISATRQALDLAESKPVIVARALDLGEAGAGLSLAGLRDRAIRLTEQKVLDLLTLGMRAGLLIMGAETVEDARKRGTVVGLIFAADTAPATVQNVAGDGAVPAWRLPLDANRLGALLGKGSRSVLGLRSGSVSPELLRQLRRLEKLR